jgi:hypothetical protein
VDRVVEGDPVFEDEPEGEDREDDQQENGHGQRELHSRARRAMPRATCLAECMAKES